MLGFVLKLIFKIYVEWNVTFIIQLRLLHVSGNVGAYKVKTHSQNHSSENSTHSKQVVNIHIHLKGENHP